MTKSPNRTQRDKIRLLLDQCEERLTGVEPVVKRSHKFQPEETAVTGFVELRFIERVSSDGACCVQETIFIHTGGLQTSDIVSVELDGQLHLPVYDDPHPIGHDS